MKTVYKCPGHQACRLAWSLPSSPAHNSKVMVHHQCHSHRSNCHGGVVSLGGFFGNGLSKGEMQSVLLEHRMGRTLEWTERTSSHKWDDTPGRLAQLVTWPTTGRSKLHQKPHRVLPEGIVLEGSTHLKPTTSQQRGDTQSNRPAGNIWGSSAILQSGFLCGL